MRGSAHSFEVVKLVADTEVAGSTLVSAPWLSPQCTEAAQGVVITGIEHHWPICRMVKVDFRALDQHCWVNKWKRKGNDIRLGSVELEMIHVVCIS